MTTLTRAATDLRATWRRLQPTLEQRSDFEDARRLTDIVAQLDAAKRPKDYVAPTLAWFTEADRVDQVLRTQPRP